VDRKEKRSWLGRRVWIASTEESRQYGTICSVDYRAFASLMIRRDGYRGAVLVEEMARGQKWDFEEANSEFVESPRCPPDLPTRP
jgi:hypothetical protein